MSKPPGASTEWQRSKRRSTPSSPQFRCTLARAVCERAGSCARHATHHLLTDKQTTVSTLAACRSRSRKLARL